jgi:DNA invertase Pin-like site-specific DNA recombinase
MFQMMGVSAEFERAMIRERVKAGLERARAHGKTLGRPTISAVTDAAIRKALKKGDTVNQRPRHATVFARRSSGIICSNSGPTRKPVSKR